MLKKWGIAAFGSLAVSLLVTLWITPQIKNLRAANQPLASSSSGSTSDSSSVLEPTPQTSSQREEGLPTSSTVSGKKGYWEVSVYEGNVAVFYNGDPKPIRVLDMPLSMLPQEDQELLKYGILVRSERELAAVLEDYS